MARPATYDRLHKKQPMERVVDVYLSDEAVIANAEAANALGRAELSRSPDIEDLRAIAATARQMLEDQTVTLRFRSIGRKSYDALVRAHPPTEAQLAESKDTPYNPEPFAVALISASCVNPSLTVDQVQEFCDEWNTAEFLQLWMAALEVNTQRRVVELGKA